MIIEQHKLNIFRTCLDKPKVRIIRDGHFFHIDFAVQMTNSIVICFGENILELNNKLPWVISETMADQCDHGWSVWPWLISVTMADQCDHGWSVWPWLISVTMYTALTCKNRFKLLLIKLNVYIKLYINTRKIFIGWTLLLCLFNMFMI